MIYRHFWSSTRKTCIFNGKIFAGLSNLLFMCPEEHLQSNVSERKSWKLMDFWINFENFGRMAEKKIFRVVKTAKDVQGNSLWKKFFKNRKLWFFFQFCAFFYFKRKLSPDLQNPQSTCAWKFVVKNNFLKLIETFTLLWILIQTTVSRKMFLPGCNNCNPRIQRHFLRKSKVFFEKSYICSSVLVFELFICLLTKKRQGVKETTY